MRGGFLRLAAAKIRSSLQPVSQGRDRTAQTPVVQLTLCEISTSKNHSQHRDAQRAHDHGGYLMSLLDDLPYGLLNQIRNATPGRIPSNSSADNAGDLPSWAPTQQQRPPLSFASPNLAANIATSSANRSRATAPLARAADSFTGADLSWSPRNRPDDLLHAQPPAPTTPNLTAQALRTKGVPEADVAAAIGNPEMIRQLIMQNYGPDSSLAPIPTGYKPSVSRARGGFFANTSGTARLDDAATLDGVPVWRGLNPASQTNPTGLMSKQADSHHEQCIARCSDLALPTGDFGIQLQRCVLACLSGGNSGFPEWDRHFP
jgi:hypothetical protein